jgi:GT2 family glycosyltransferase
MRSIGVNAVRTYTVPPPWLLDLANQHGLLVMIGIPWGEHLSSLDDKAWVASVERTVRKAIRTCARHPAVLCYAIGNEIPSSIVRWHGYRRIEKLLRRLYRAAKDEDPEALVTYVNYPSTEYLELPFLDLVCFNLYLESLESFDAYVARLQNQSGDRPLLLTEMGLDSRRHGEAEQARVLEEQLDCAFASGCAGGFVFAWTDEWFRGGSDIEDWHFGVTTTERRAKPALAAIRRAFSRIPVHGIASWPSVSVIVCTYNREHALRECCEALLELEYPNYEVIVVDDGSTDNSAAIASEFGFRVISVGNGGLSNARNRGLDAATGEIVAYLDDDARPDQHWLCYLVATFSRTVHAGVGGPNLIPESQRNLRRCVGHSPGNPVPVLISDREAEHIAGCNMAFRKECLREIGGFDPQFVLAGDDVDVCWRLQDRGWSLGFSPAAVVWHEPRSSLRAYWRQQREYGRAEAKLERKWPEKYNTFGHRTWGGRLYGGARRAPFGRRRVRYGLWGTAEFQSTEATSTLLTSLPTTPEWYLLIMVLALLTGMGAVWSRLLVAGPLLGVSVLMLLTQSTSSAARLAILTNSGSWGSRLSIFLMTSWLHLLQPLARLGGRMQEGLTPWRRRAPRSFSLPLRHRRSLWSDSWQSPDSRLRALERFLRSSRAALMRGSQYDRWDLEVLGGLFGSARLRMVIEEHGAGKQLARFLTWPRCSRLGRMSIAVFAPLSILAMAEEAILAAVFLGAAACGVVLAALKDCAVATAALLGSLRHLSTSPSVESASTANAAGPILRGRANGSSPDGWPRGARLPVLDPVEVPRVPREAENDTAEVAQ